jgi:hypothetical protein
MGPHYRINLEIALMMNRTSSLAALLAAAVLTAACGSSDYSGSDMVAISDPVDPDEVTCKTVVKTGTRIGSRVCKTNRAWEQQARDSKAAAMAIQTESKQGPGPQ